MPQLHRFSKYNPTLVYWHLVIRTTMNRKAVDPLTLKVGCWFWQYFLGSFRSIDRAAIVQSMLWFLVFGFLSFGITGKVHLKFCLGIRFYPSKNYRGAAVSRSCFWMNGLCSLDSRLLVATAVRSTKLYFLMLPFTVAGQEHASCDTAWFGRMYLHAVMKNSAASNAWLKKSIWPLLLHVSVCFA